MNTKEKIEVMQGYEDGEVVECDLLRKDHWALLKDTFLSEGQTEPYWDWRHNNYRIKPEPKEFWINTAHENPTAWPTKKRAEEVYCGDQEIIKVREVL